MAAYINFSYTNSDTYVYELNAIFSNLIFTGCFVKCICTSHHIKGIDEDTWLL